MRMKYRPERALSKKHPRPLRPGTGNVHRAALKTRIIGRSAMAAETRDPEPKSHRKASTWPAYSAPPQNHPTTHRQPETTRRLVGKTLPKTRQRKRRTRRVRRARRERTKTTKTRNRSRQNP